MSDFFARRDLGAVTSFADPLAKFDFGFESDEHLVHNDAGLKSGISLEVSFDGQDVHGRAQANGPSKVISWSNHVRKAIWVRKDPTSPLGSVFVEVIATTR